jgi:hypothetical protein
MSHVEHDISYDDGFDLPRFAVRQPSHPQMQQGIPQMQSDDRYYQSPQAPLHDDKRTLPRIAQLADDHAMGPMPSLSPMGTPQLPPPASLSRSQSMASSANRRHHGDDLERTLSDASRPYYQPQQFDPYTQAQEHIRRGSYTTDQRKDYPQAYAAGTPTASNTYNDPYAPPRNADVKAEPASPRFQQYPPYSPMDSQPAPSGTPRTYMATPARAPSASTPNTPMTNNYGPRPPSQYYQPKPARQGFRVVHDPKDLQPRVNSTPAGRRYADGTYLSVRPCCPCVHCVLILPPATPRPHHPHHTNLQPLQPRLSLRDRPQPPPGPHKAQQARPQRRVR